GTEIPQSQDPTITSVADEATTTSVGVRTEGANTTTTGLDAGLASDNIHESPLRSNEEPIPEGNTSGSADDSLNLKELMDIVPKLVLRIDNLEKELQQTKSTYGKAVLTLVERVSASGEAQEEDISPTTLEAAKTLSTRRPLLDDYKKGKKTTEI
ncbi:hypothetical protein Tco_1349997, partial [Tanacetum coccineum]